MLERDQSPLVASMVDQIGNMASNNITTCHKLFWAQSEKHKAERVGADMFSDNSLKLSVVETGRDASKRWHAECH